MGGSGWRVYAKNAFAFYRKAQHAHLIFNGAKMRQCTVYTHMVSERRRHFERV